ncbi:hypothetical protein F8O01_06750 [Pseudoclavibacter chungangensis]|uniref:Thiamine pyrophosphate-binding protein n=1 Tax=Pseudoclavibacter chungangensis TaxID=587635 RepID=A0A7J5BUD2_9MICO|nr:hypothetical protein F8O01_06750 [Pseudoclavibacter chungangensis]
MPPPAADALERDVRSAFAAGDPAVTQRGDTSPVDAHRPSSSAAPRPDAASAVDTGADATRVTDDVSIDADTAPIAVNRSGVAFVDGAGVVGDRARAAVMPEPDVADTTEAETAAPKLESRTPHESAALDHVPDGGQAADGDAVTDGSADVEPVPTAFAAVEPTALEPTALEPTALEPTRDEPTAVEPTRDESTIVEPTAVDGADDEPTASGEAADPHAEPGAYATSDDHRPGRADERLAAAFVRLGIGQVVTTGGAGATEHALSTRGVVVTSIERPGAAVAAADVGVRVSGRLGVVLLDDAAAAAASIAEAADAGSGLVVLVRPGRTTRDADADLVRATGAIVLADETDRPIDEHLERALRTAALDGRPVVLRVPESAPAGASEHTPHPTTRRSIVAHPGDSRRIRPAPGQLEGLQSALLGAERPVFVAGPGASDAAGAILALADECGALLATGDASVGTFRESGVRSPADIGSVGAHATPLARELCEGADLVVAWGGAVAGPTTQLVRIDDDPSALGALDVGQIGIVGDCTLTAVDALQVLQRERLLREAAEAGPRRTGRRAAPADDRTVEREAAALLADDGQAIFEELDPLPPLTDAPPAPMRARSSFTPATARAATGPAAASEEAAPPRTGYRSPDVLARIAGQRDWRDVPFEDASGATGTGWRIDARRLVTELGEALPDDRIVVVGAGRRATVAARRLAVRDAAGHVPAVSRDADAIASAIGAARSAPARLPVLVTDDSGFRGGLAELGTAVRSGIPLVVVVLDASPAGAEDLAAVAGALGAQEMRVREPGDLGAVTRQLAERSPGASARPLVIVANVVEQAD